jgi:spore coat polysaccharide biosynthesis protein SpsF (cytidylyltransferase family)
MKTIIFLQARLGSKRLPRKALLLVEGESVLSRVIERLRPLNIPIVLVTGSRSKNRKLIAEATRCKVPYFCGSEENVLDRFYRASLTYKPTTIVRVTGDCPLIDSGLIKKGLAIFKRGTYDMVTNGRVRSFPDGLDYEIFSRAALNKAWKLCRGQHASERVFLRTFINPTKAIGELPLRVKDVVHIPNLARKRWTLDYPRDLSVIRAVYRAFARSDFTWKDVLSFMQKHPELSRLNERHLTLDY